MVNETGPAPTELPRIAQTFNYTPYRESDFERKGLRAFLQYRDLGLKKASGGLMRAEHIRMVGTPDEKTGWHCHDLDFQFVFVLKGYVKFITEDGATITLRAGDGAHLPPFYRHDEIEFSSDFEVIEIVAPSDVRTIVGRDAALPVRPTRPNRVAKFAASYDKPEAYKVGDGPRKFLAYRDVAATEATGRRVNINVVRNSKAGDSSTGWHYHSLACQFIYVLKGWSRVEIENEGEFTIRAGESMTIPPKLKHDVTGFSADFTVLELNIPADYDTVACDPPGRRAA
ncbi:MAG: cupin domain-containing protein [Alphaproteobacteria bacterium]